jgi:hypothetical protein
MRAPGDVAVRVSTRVAREPGTVCVLFYCHVTLVVLYVLRPLRVLCTTGFYAARSWRTAARLSSVAHQKPFFGTHRQIGGLEQVCSLLRQGSLDLEPHRSGRLRTPACVSQQRQQRVWVHHDYPVIDVGPALWACHDKSDW